MGVLHAGGLGVRLAIGNSGQDDSFTVGKLSFADVSIDSCDVFEVFMCCGAVARACRGSLRENLATRNGEMLMFTEMEAWLYSVPGHSRIIRHYFNGGLSNL